MSDVDVFEFTGGQGVRLSGRLHRPDQRAKGSVLMAHCFTCSKDLATMSRLARGLAEAGYAALRFDFTGLGESAGDFAETSVSANVSDLTRAAASLIAEGYGPCGLIGHSLGGAASILAAARLKTVRSLVTIGAPAATVHIRHLLSDALPDLDSGRASTITVAGRTFDLNPEFVSDLERHDVLAAAAGLDRPYCVIHARDDSVVGFDNAQRLYEAAAEPKRLVDPPSGDHLFIGTDNAETVLRAVVDWFEGTL